MRGRDGGHLFWRCSELWVGEGSILKSDDGVEIRHGQGPDIGQEWEGHGFVDPRIRTTLRSSLLVAQAFLEGDKVAVSLSVFVHGIIMARSRASGILIRRHGSPLVHCHHNGCGRVCGEGCLGQ